MRGSLLCGVEGKSMICFTKNQKWRPFTCAGLSHSCYRFLQSVDSTGQLKRQSRRTQTTDVLPLRSKASKLRDQTNRYACIDFVTADGARNAALAYDRRCILSCAVLSGKTFDWQNWIPQITLGLGCCAWGLKLKIRVRLTRSVAASGTRPAHQK